MTGWTEFRSCKVRATPCYRAAGQTGEVGPVSPAANLEAKPVAESGAKRHDGAVGGSRGPNRRGGRMLARGLANDL